MSNRLNFLIACNERNMPFVFPFIWFAKETNPNASFEFHITDANALLDALFKNGLSYIRSKCENRISIVPNKTQIKPQYYRFLVDPINFMTEYTYIGDIDILICENVLASHMNRVQRQDFIYDNEIRFKQNRLTGLHLVRNDKWYPLTKSARQLYYNSKNLNINDEVMLYDICNKSNIKMYPETLDGVLKNRPIHGQHLSLSRRPFTQSSSMPCVVDARFKDIFLKTISSNEFQTLLSFCPKFNKILKAYCDFVKIGI